MTEETEEVQEEVQAPVETPAPVPTMIDEANAAAKRLEEANARHEQLIAREEEIAARNMLGGKTKAGKPVVQEESAEDYAKRVLEGGIDGKKA